MAGRLNRDAMEAFVSAVQIGDGKKISAFCAPQVTFTDTMAPGKTFSGRSELYHGFVRPFEQAFSDVRYQVDEAIYSDRALLLIGSVNGTFVGDYLGFPATGRRVRWEFQDVYYFEDGEISRIRYTSDTLWVAQGARRYARRCAPVATNGPQAVGSKKDSEGMSLIDRFDSILVVINAQPGFYAVGARCKTLQDAVCTSNISQNMS